MSMRPKGFSRMYQAAQTDLLTADWNISITSANAENLVSAIAIRARMRQLERDEAYFRRMLRLYQNNVVGHRGFRLKKVTGIDGAYDRDISKKVRAAWHEYLLPENCTTYGNMSGVQVQRLGVRCFKRDGVILFREHIGPQFPFGYALEPIEVDRLDHWWNRPAVGTANQIQFGIEMDRLKKPLAMWILTRHPGDVFAWRTGPEYRERVPAGEVIMWHDFDRAEQIIGMPDLCAVACRMNMLSKYEESEAVASRAAAAKGGWFKRMGTEAKYEGPETPGGDKIMDATPGEWEELPIGMEPVERNPTHPNDAYPDFIKGQLRGASAGAGLSYNAVANDLEGVNYSSIRAGLLEDREQFKYDQELGISSLMNRWYEGWMPMAVLSGRLELTVKEMDRARRAHWQPRRWDWVDPVKDVTGKVMEMEAHITPLRRIISEDEDGGDIEEILAEMQEDMEMAEEYGIDISGQVSTPKIPPGEPGEDAPAQNGNGKGKKSNGHVDVGAALRTMEKYARFAANDPE
jgi:lambda family phage portal protein